MKFKQRFTSLKLVQKMFRLYNEVRVFAARCLNHKKIVVISDSNIISIPISIRLQSVALGLVVCCMLWVSYSTGKYFAFETIISEKDREIWNSSLTNEDLQYQVRDLNNNLQELSRYFASVKAYEQAPDNQVSQQTDKQTAKLADANRGDVTIVANAKKTPIETQKQTVAESEENKNQNDENVRNILRDIRKKVGERISGLESIIDMTGVNIKTVASHNLRLKEVMEERNQSSNAQGGPFIPVSTNSFFDNNRFESEIDYLLELEKIIHSFPIASPLQNYYVSSRFGRRVDPIRRTIAVHSGLDMVGKYGSAVHSSAPGKVIFAGRKGAYGYYVELRHASGITTRYGHLKEIKVRSGEQIRRGQIIGLQGNTGRSTGSHLHYEVRLNGKAIDPYNFLKAGRYVF